ERVRERIDENASRREVHRVRRRDAAAREVLDDRAAELRDAAGENIEDRTGNDQRAARDFDETSGRSGNGAGDVQYVTADVRGPGRAVDLAHPRATQREECSRSNARKIARCRETSTREVEERVRSRGGRKTRGETRVRIQREPGAGHHAPSAHSEDRTFE